MTKRRALAAIAARYAELRAQGGESLAHSEILVDLERSRSFVPEEDAAVAQRFPGRLPFSDLFWHGTAVASIVASNAKIVAGVNRYVTLIAVKIADSTNSSSLSRFLSGIVYAVDQGADVINMSIGRERDKSANSGIVAAFERAANYAFRKGAIIVSVPFNDAADLDHNGDLVRLPCESTNVICVSATGPTAAAVSTGRGKTSMRQLLTAGSDDRLLTSQRQEVPAFPSLTAEFGYPAQQLRPRPKDSRRASHQCVASAGVLRKAKERASPRPLSRDSLRFLSRSWVTANPR